MTPTVPELQQQIAQLAAMPYGLKRLAMVEQAIKMARNYKTGRNQRDSKAYDDPDKD